MFAATTTVSVLRSPSDALDDFEDASDTDTVVASRLPAHISTVTRTHFEPGTRELTTIEILTARIRWRGGSINPTTDSLRDDRTSETITIDTVNPGHYGGLDGGEIVVTSRRVY